MSNTLPSKDWASRMADKCQGVAYCLSYNDGIQGDAKQMLHEAAHFFDANSVKVTKKKDGLLMRDARGRTRYMSIRERLAYWLLGKRLSIRP